MNDLVSVCALGLGVAVVVRLTRWCLPTLAVTMPSTSRTVCPTRGDWNAMPWISVMLTASTVATCKARESQLSNFSMVISGETVLQVVP